MTSVLTVEQLRAVVWIAAKAVVLFVLAIWFVAASAGAYLAVFGFWPFLSLAYLIIWAVARFAAHADTSGWGISVQQRSGRLRRRVGGADLPLGKRVFVTVNPHFSVELAAPRLLEAVYLILWAPFVLQSPLYVTASLLLLAGREELRVVIEWSWLAIGAVLLAGFYVSLVACVSWAAREFVGPRMIGRRLAIPFLGRALCIAHRDVCAVEVVLDPGRADHVRLIRTGGEPMELRFAARFMGGVQPTADLLPLAELLAHAAQVPLRTK